MLFTSLFITVKCKGYKFEIKGNNFTDSAVILALLDPENINKEFINDIIRYIVKEFPNINKIYYKNNERLKDEELDLIASQLEIKNLNIISINSFINETKSSMNFGYNNVKLIIRVL